MCKSIPGTQKHLTMDQRITIEKGLDQGRSLRSIALQLGKDPTTISKEIKKHRSFQEHNHFNDSKNKCALVKDCKKKNICVNSVITAIPIAMTSLLALIIAQSWIKLLLSAMPAARKVDAGWTKPIIGPRPLIGNTAQFCLNPGPVSIFLRKI